MPAPGAIEVCNQGVLHMPSGLMGWWELERDAFRRRIANKMASMRNWRVGVLYGATSVEDGTYLRHKPSSQLSVMDITRSFGNIGISSEWVDPTAPDFIASLEGLDAAFLNTHGPFGEDGNLQGLLAYLGIPYTGSGVAPSGVAADKRLMKLMLHGARVRTLPSQRVKPEWGVPDRLPSFPFMLKACLGGSSIGLSLVSSRSEFARALAEHAGQGFRDFIIEPFVEGVAVTVPVLYFGGSAVMMPPLACKPAAVYYDGPSKLGCARGPSVEFQPIVDRSHPWVGPIHEAMHAICSALDFDGAIRADFLVEQASGEPIFLEINTIPGVQKNSNLMLSAHALGIEDEEILAAILASADNAEKLVPWRHVVHEPAACDGKAELPILPGMELQDRLAGATHLRGGLR